MSPPSPNTCLRCFGQLQDSDKVTIQPCGCSVCKDCLIEFLWKPESAASAVPNHSFCLVCYSAVESHTRTRCTTGQRVTQPIVAGAGPSVVASPPVVAVAPVADAATPPTKAKHKNPAKKRKLPVAAVAATSEVGESTNPPVAAAPEELAATNDPPKKRKSGPPKGKKRMTFDERLQKLREYKAAHGDCWIPEHHPIGIGGWVIAVRNGKVKTSKEQRAALNAVGFEWETKKSRQNRLWQSQLDRLLAFERVHGHMRVPEKYHRAPQEAETIPSLYEWCHTQRRYFAKGWIKEDRLQKLKAVGFDFCPLQRGKNESAQENPQHESNEEEEEKEELFYDAHQKDGGEEAFYQPEELRHFAV